MKNNLKEELFVRKQVKKILLEQDGGLTWSSGVIDPGFDALYKTFVGPFANVFKVAQVAFKDSLSISIDVVKYSLATSDEKRAEIKQRYREKREKYKGQMETAMKDVDAALQGEDAKFFGFFAAPHVFLGKGLASAAWGTVKEPLMDVADEHMSGLLGTRDPEKYQLDAASTQNIGQSIADAMKGLFFQQEAIDYMDDLENILLEQEEAKPTKEPSDAVKQELAANYLERTGLAQQYEDQWSEIVSAKQEEIDAILKERKVIVDLLTQISEVQDFAGADQLVGQLKQYDTDLSGPLGEAKTIAQEQMAKIKSGDEEGLKILEDLKQHPDAKAIPEGAPVEQYNPLIEKGILAATFGDAVAQAREAAVGELLGFVAEMNEKDLAELAKLSDKGKQYHDMIMKFKNDLLAI